MKVYIASSWKNQHTVEMLTDLLRKNGIGVLSFVEHNRSIGFKEESLLGEEWFSTHQASQAFEFDSEAAMNCDLCIYISPSGKDAATEVGMAFAKGRPILGLSSKGEDFGLMRKAVSAWFGDYRQLIEAVVKLSAAIDYVKTDK